MLPGWLWPEGAQLGARLLLRRPPPRLLWAGSSVSLSFSCSSFRKKSTNKPFSFLIWSLMSVGMSGIIQSTRTLRNITRFCQKSQGGGLRGEAQPQGTPGRPRLPLPVSNGPRSGPGGVVPWWGLWRAQTWKQDTAVFFWPGYLLAGALSQRAEGPRSVPR